MQIKNIYLKTACALKTEEVEVTYFNFTLKNAYNKQKNKNVTNSQFYAVVRKIIQGKNYLKKIVCFRN